MAVKLFTGFETADILSDAGVAVTGTGSISTGQQRTGARSLRLNPASGANGYISLGSMSGQNYWHFGLYVASLPSVDRLIFVYDAINVRLTSTGALKLYTGSTLLATTSGTPFSTTGWHWLGIRCVGGTSVVFVKVDGQDALSGTIATINQGNGTIGPSNSEASAVDLYVDDLIVDDSGFLDPSNVVLLVPVGDSSRSNWFKADGTTTTNLWQSVDNIPFAGVASANESANPDASILNPASSAGSYVAELTDYTTAGVGANDTIIAVQTMLRHGEDIATNSKTGTWGAVTNPTISDSLSVTFGDDAGAHGAEAGNWKTARGTLTASPSGITKGTRPTLTVSRGSQSRVACVDFMGMYVAYTPPSSYTQDLTAVGAIASAEAFGTVALTYNQTLSGVGGIASAGAFGSVTVTTLTAITAVGAITSAEALGLVEVHSVYHVTTAGGIASAESFGTTAVTSTYALTTVGAIASAAAFGTAVVTFSYPLTGVGAIASAEAFGAVTVSPGAVTLTAQGVPSAAAFGTATVSQTGATQDLTDVGGIASAEAFGTTFVANLTTLVLYASETGYLTSTSSVYADADSGSNLTVSDDADVRYERKADLSYDFRQAFILFDTSAIPADAVIMAAELALWVDSVGGWGMELEASLFGWSAPLTTGEWMDGDTLWGLTYLVYRDASQLSLSAYTALLDDSANLRTNLVKAGSMGIVLFAGDEGGAPSHHGGDPGSWEEVTWSTHPARLTVTFTGNVGLISTVGGIASAEAFGTPTVSSTYPVEDVGGIASGEAFGTPVVAYATQAITAGAIASAEAFGTAIVGGTYDISGAGGIPSAEAFGTAVTDIADLTVGPYGTDYLIGPVTGGWTYETIRQLLIDQGMTPQFEAVIDSVLVGNGSSSGTNVSVGGPDGGIYSDFAAGTRLNPSGSFGTHPHAIAAHEFGHVITQYYLYLTHAADWTAYLDFRGIDPDDPRIGSTYVWSLTEMIAEDYRQLFGDATAQSELNQSNTDITDANDIPGFADWFVNVWFAGRPVDPSGIASAEAFGTAVVTAAQGIYASGIPSAEAFGSATLAGPVTASGIPSEEAFGTAIVNAGATLITGTGAIPSGEAFGTPTVTPGAVTVTASAIASAEAFGQVAVSPGAVAITGAGGIASAEAFGTPALSVGAVTLTASGIVSEEAFGNAVVSAGGTFVTGAGGIGSGEAFGAASVSPGPVTVTISSIASAEAFGTAVLTYAQRLTVASIVSAESFGRARLLVAVTSKLRDMSDGLAAAMAGIAANIYPWPAPSVTVPCLVVGFPTEMEYDLTYDRGADQFTIPVWYVAGPSAQKATRDAMSTGIEALRALDGGYQWGDVRLLDVRVEEVRIGAVAYLAARASFEVVG